VHAYSDIRNSDRLGCECKQFFNQWWHTHITAASLPNQLNWAYQWSPLNSLSKMFLLHMSQMWRTYWQIQWTVPQLSIMIIYNSTWSILMQWIWVELSGDKLTFYTQKKAYFLFVINLITPTMKYNKSGRRLKMCGTMLCQLIQLVIGLRKFIIIVTIPFLEDEVSAV